MADAPGQVDDDLVRADRRQGPTRIVAIVAYHEHLGERESTVSRLSHIREAM